MSGVQMDPNLHLSTYVKDKTDPSKVVTGVVPTTHLQCPSQNGKKNTLLKNDSTIVFQCVFIRILMYLMLTMWGLCIGCLGF